VRKYVLSLLFLLLMVTAFAQKRPVTNAAPASKKSLVILISSESSEMVKASDGKATLKVHKGVFKQDYSILRSDSAYFYPDQNALDAFGHVNINQGDTLNIYSDKLNYNGNTKVAILTDHVKMIDKDATLTTDYLTYNTATRIATYTGGGKLVNKDNTLVSKNGYYFSFTRDAYFRYDVVCNTPDAVIKSDTLRYNSGIRTTYFYGPTHIYGKKDKDTLYTENGDYNTITEISRFGKKNLYSQGTKTLKGDSLFYDRLKGYGRAVKHVVFNDNEQKSTIYGDLGEYYKADDRAVITQNPYVVFITEDKDTTQTDTVKGKIKVPGKTNAIDNKLTINKTDPLVKKLGLKADSLNKKVMVPVKVDSINKKLTISKTDPLVKKLGLKVDSLSKKPNSKVDSAIKKQIASSTIAKPKGAPVKSVVATVKSKTDTASKAKIDTARRIKRDSLFMAADTIETQIVTYKALKDMQRARFLANNIDTSIKVIKTVLLTKLPKFISIEAPKLRADTSMYHRGYFGKPKPKAAPVKKKPVKPVDPKKAKADSIKNKIIADSLAIIADHGLKDTSRVRIISGHHHSKIFKSDLQAKSDSMFYSNSDSTIRMYVHPMIWTQGSQLSGDTINLQMKNRKLDNIDLYPNAFIVNIDKGDSVHFNQIGGKAMHGTFKDSKLNTMLVIGNAETIAVSKDSVTHKPKDLLRTLSYKLFVQFKNGEINRITLMSKPDQRALPFDKSKEEDRVLKGFIWKPKDRPLSKESIIHTYNPPVKKKPAVTKAGPVKGTVPVKTPFKKTDNKPESKSPVVIPSNIKPVKDSVISIKPDTVKKTDTIKRIVTPKLKGSEDN